jgi:hypothetical protein
MLDDPRHFYRINTDIRETLRIRDQIVKLYEQVEKVLIGF